MQNARLYIGGLAWACTDYDLEQLFSGAGEVVSAVVIMERETGRSRGFGFVEMASAEEAEKAIEMFNETEHMGRNIIVNIAQPRV